MKRRPFIAVLTRGEALGSIVKMILTRDGDRRVVTFSDADQLLTHLKIAPADLIISDYELDGQTAPELLTWLRRAAPARRFASLVLTDRVTRKIRQSCAFADVDEVIIKPMSPFFLQERVTARLAKAGRLDEREARPMPRRYPGSNVVPLFGDAGTGHGVPEFS